MKFSIHSLFACLGTCSVVVAVSSVRGHASDAERKLTDTTVVVSPSNLHGWSYENFDTDAALEFAAGPETAPLGLGSACFSHAGPAGVNGGTLHTSYFDGVKLAEITELKLSGYSLGEDQLLYQTPYFQLFLDVDDDGVFDDRIIFEPWFQNGAFTGSGMVTNVNGVDLTDANKQNVQQNGITIAGVPSNQWFEWDLLVASWWRIPGPYGGKLSEVGIGFTPLVTIGGIVQGWPNAKIVMQQGSTTNTGGVRLQYGFGGISDQLIGCHDEFVFGTVTDRTTYDFEPNRPPDCSQAYPSINTVWPPNHKFVQIEILGITDPDGPFTVTIDSIVQNEPVDDTGDGKFTPDAQGVGTSTAEVRAERAGSGDGRVYHISFTADDGFGGECMGSVQVCVPHDKSVGCVEDDIKQVKEQSRVKKNKKEADIKQVKEQSRVKKNKKKAKRRKRKNMPRRKKLRMGMMKKRRRRNPK